MDISNADFVDDDFEEIMKDLDVVDSWMDEDDAEELLDDKPASSREPSENIHDSKAKKCDVADMSNKKNLDGGKISSLDLISDVEEKDCMSFKRRVQEKNNYKSNSREGREKTSRGTRNNNKEGHTNDRNGSHNARDDRHGNRDGRLPYKEGHGDRERYNDIRKSRYQNSREQLLSPGRESGRRRVERSPNYYGNDGNRRDLSKTYRDIRKDKEEKDSLRHLHKNPDFSKRRSRSRSRLDLRSFSENFTQIQNNSELHALSPNLVPPGISPGPPFSNELNNPANFYPSLPMGTQSNFPMYHNGPGIPMMYEQNMGNPVIMPAGAYNSGMEFRPPLGYECYAAPYLAEPMQVMPPMYSESVAPPILSADSMLPPENRPAPDSQEALDKLLADKSISLEDYLKLTTRPKAPTAEFPKPRSKSVEKRHELLDRCHEAVAKLTKLQLPNRLIVSHVIREPVRQSDVKYCSPLKRHPAVRYNFTTPSKNASQQNKQLLNSVLTTIGLEKMLLPDKNFTKQKKNTKDAAVQTVVPLCDKCEVRRSIETSSKETSIDRLYLTKSVSTQINEKELANTKSIFTANDSLHGPTISLSHMTPAQILASKLSTRAKTLKSQQPTDIYDEEMSRGFTRRQQFSQYEQRDIYDARRTQDELFEQRVSLNDAMYDQRGHHNQMHSQSNQLFEKRPIPDEQRYNPY